MATQTERADSAKKPVRKTTTKKRLAARRPAKRSNSRSTKTLTPKAVAPSLSAPVATGFYPAPQYTRWTLVMIGEFYLVSILLALVLLGIVYWVTAMTNVWSTLAALS